LIEFAESCYVTPHRSIGGRAWFNVILHNSRYENALLVWSNSTLGLMLHWWEGTRQQSGRSCISVFCVCDMLTLDIRKLDGGQLRDCDRVEGEEVFACE